MTPHGISAVRPDPVLARFPRFASDDLDEVRLQVGQVFCEHDLRVVGPGQRLDTRLYFRSGRDVGLGRMCYGAGVDIDPGKLKDFFLLQMPVRGHETIVAGAHTVYSTPSMASIVSPSLAFHMRHGAGTEKLFLRIDRAALERQFLSLYGRPPRGAIEFVPGIDLGSTPGQALQRLTGWMFAEASDGAMLEQPLVSVRIEEVLMTTLLEGLAHNQARDGREAGAGTVSPRFVRRAIDYMLTHCDEPLTAGAIAQQAGVSTRSLFAGFRTYRSTTPMAFLRDLRLDKVHAELQQASGPGAVTTTAMRWGFMHLGQFSAAYRRRFGLLPSQTRALADAPQRR